MGFPPGAWFDEIPSDDSGAAAAENRDLASRVEHLFQTIRHPGAGEPYTNAEVARMTLGDLSEEDVEGIRTGRIADPTVGQVAAAFGVPASYLVDRKEAPTLDAELLEALSDETTREITREALRLPEREREIVFGIVREFGETR
jgi:hypothetical protein